jgi:hypothetical protein
VRFDVICLRSSKRLHSPIILVECWLPSRTGTTKQNFENGSRPPREGCVISSASVSQAIIPAIISVHSSLVGYNYASGIRRHPQDSAEHYFSC